MSATTSNSDGMQSRPQSSSSTTIGASPSTSRPSSLAASQSQSTSTSSAANSKSATITYTGSSTFLNSSLCSHALKALQSQLPLRNLHWRPTIKTASTLNQSSTSTTTQIRTIQTLPVKLIPLTSNDRSNITSNAEELNPFDSSDDHHPASLLSKPLVNIYFVTTQDGDYRSTVRSDIRSWLAAIQASGANGNSRSDSASSANSATSPSSRPSTPTSNPVRSASPVQISPSTPSQANSSSTSDTKPEYLIVLLSPQSDPSSSRNSELTNSSAPAAKPSGVSRFYSKSSTATGAAGSGTTNASTGNASQVDAGAASMLEKMRSDFAESSKDSGGVKGAAAVAKKERVIHISRLPSVSDSSNFATQDPTILAPLITALRECTTSSFSTGIKLVEESISRNEEKRFLSSGDEMSRENWSEWFSSQETLARTFESVGLPEDALVRWKEMDRALGLKIPTFSKSKDSETSSEGMASKMDEEGRCLLLLNPLGPLQPNSDSNSILSSTSHVPFNQTPATLLLRQDSRASLFALRCYIFSKRAMLLGELGRVGELMNETPGFLARASGLLKWGEKPLPVHFRESWTFSSALDIVEQCQAWLIARGDLELGAGEGESQLSPAFHSAKAELLDLARRQLDRIGMKVGHLPSTVPFSLSLDPSQDGSDEVGRSGRDLPSLPLGEDGESIESGLGNKISRQELLNAIESREVFDLQYVTLAERVVAGWMNGARKRNVLRLRAILGSLDFHRERYAEAYTTFVALPEPYAEARWDQIEAQLLVRQLECHARLKKPRDRAWVSVVVALLRSRHRGFTSLKGASIAGEQRDWAEDDEQRWWDSRYLFDSLRSASSSYEKEVPVSSYEGLAIKPLSNTAQLPGDEDGSTLLTQVSVALDAPLNVEDVRICLTSKAREQLWFTSGRTTLQPGQSQLLLRCSSSAPGTYMVDVSQVRIARVIFQTVAPRGLDKEGMPTSFFINIPEDGDSLHANVDLPQLIALDEQRCAEIEIDSGRNELDRLELKLSGSNGQALEGLPEAILVENSSADSPPTELNPTEEGSSALSLSVQNLAPRTKLKFRFPLYEMPEGSSSFFLSISIDYWTSTGVRAQSRRQYQKSVDLPVGLPLGVNVQDFFRHSCLLSKFSISAAGNNLLRLKPAHLDYDPNDTSQKELEIKSPSLNSSSPSAVIVTPRQPASYLFRVQPKSTKSKVDGAEPPRLRVILTYRTLQEEAQAIILAHFEKVVSSSTSGLQDSSFISLRNFLKRSLKDLIPRKLDLPAYVLTGELRFILLDVRAWTREVTSRCGLASNSKETRMSIEAVKATLNLGGQGGPSDWKLLEVGFEGTAQTTSNNVPKGWRAVSIPMEVPSVDIVNAVEVVQSDPLEEVVVGRPVQARVTIETSFAWGTLSSSSGSTVRLSYDVTADFENWLVSGSKRNAYELQVPAHSTSTDTKLSSYQFEITLVPLRHGPLVLPNVAVRPLPPAPISTPPSNAHISPAERQATNQRIQQEANNMPTCETYQRNAAHSVEVLPRRISNQNYFVDMHGARLVEVAADREVY